MLAKIRGRNTAPNFNSNNSYDSDEEEGLYQEYNKTYHNADTTRYPTLTPQLTSSWAYWLLSSLPALNRYHNAYMSMTAPTASGSSSNTVITNRTNHLTNERSSPAKKQVRFHDNIKNDSDEVRIRELGKRMNKEQVDKYAQNNTGFYHSLLAYPDTFLLILFSRCGSAVWWLLTIYVDYNCSQ